MAAFATCLGITPGSELVHADAPRPGRVRASPKGHGMPRHDVCVIFNPTAGKNRARRRLERLRAAWAGHADFWPTDRSGHARELARAAAMTGYRVVAAAGGDGTAHEVLNGLMSAGRAEVHFSIIPIGSANDYAHSLGLDGVHGPPPAS